jgi:hypothetical protein
MDKKRPGRPRKELDPDAIRLLVSRGAKITEIADLYGVNSDTVHNNYSAEIVKGKADLKTNLRQWQLDAARQGNSALLIWLGKQYLGQTDSAIDEHLLNAIKAAGLTKEDLIQLIQNKDKLAINAKKKSFEEFCEAAGYPKPYPKQLEMLDFSITEDSPRLLLGARAYGKTNYVTVLGVAYDVYLHGTNTSNLIITKSKTRNSAIMLEIATALNNNGVSLEMQNSSCIRYPGLIGKDHSVEAITVKTSMRGRHPKRIIMDDIVTDEDTSEAMRLLVKKKYDESYNLCKNIVILGQPSHAYDLYAELRPQIKKMEVPWGSIPELDADLEAMKLAGINPAAIEMNFHLRVPKTGALPFEDIKYLDAFPPGESTIAFVDPAFEGIDYTAMTIIRAYLGGVAIVGFCWRKSWNTCVDDIVAGIKKYNVKRLAFETNALGEMPIDMLRQVVPKSTGVIGLKSNGNKHSRICAAGAHSHLLHLSKESHKEYIRQIAQYEFRAKADDSPDSLASCLRWAGLIRGAND